MRQHIVQIHMPHQTVAVPCTDKSKAQEVFSKLISQASRIYGTQDNRGASIAHCLQWGRYEITRGYFIQLTEEEVDEVPQVSWLPIERR